MSIVRINNLGITDGTIVNADINASAGITLAKLSGVNDAKAWVNFNGTGTVAIAASFNVSSITDHGTGDYTVNFTNAMSDSNFCSLCFSGDTPAAIHSLIPSSYTPSASNIRVSTFDSSLVALDVSLISVAVFR